MDQLVTSPVTRTRAQVLRDKVKIRLATDEAGPLIAALLKANNIVLPGETWERVFPNWLIATVDDEVIGCVMVLPGRPIGFLEFLFAKPSANFKFRAIAIRKLLLQGMATIQHAGASYVAGMVDVSNKRFQNVLDNLNFIGLTEHRAYLKRLA
mgnify:FL=1